MLITLVLLLEAPREPICGDATGVRKLAYDGSLTADDSAGCGTDLTALVYLLPVALSFADAEGGGRVPASACAVRLRVLLEPARMEREELNSDK